MFEGNELEGKIGTFGGYSADVSDKGIVKVALSVEVDLIAEIEKLAAKSETPIDDKAIAWIKLLLGRA